MSDLANQCTLETSPSFACARGGWDFFVLKAISIEVRNTDPFASLGMRAGRTGALRARAKGWGEEFVGYRSSLLVGAVEDRMLGIVSMGDG
jgi:hypothetical protein